MSKITKEQTAKNIKKVVIEEVVRFIAFTIVMISISALFASILPVGIYWIWLTKTASDSLYLLVYEILFGIVWIATALYWGISHIKNAYHKKIIVLNRRIRAIRRRYELSSMIVDDLD